MACDGRAKACWSATNTTTHTSSCCRSQTPSLSCKCSLLLLVSIRLTRCSPGDWLDYNIDELEGFKYRLNERLAPPAGSSLASTDPAKSDWTVHSTLAQWYRPNFEQHMYPFLPPHSTRPKECKKLYLLQLPETRVLSVPKNMKLLAVPLFELYDNSQRYGPQLLSLIHI